jgi:hypothetical protein
MLLILLPLKNVIVVGAYSDFSTKPTGRVDKQPLKSTTVVNEIRFFFLLNVLDKIS